MKRIIAWILVLASCFGMLSVTASATQLPFTDVASDAYYAAPVAWAVEKGITQGVTETTFAPNATCTRGQVVTFLHRAAGSPEPTKTTHNFTDIHEGDYYYDAVLWAVEKGITTGVSETTFAPNATCTRGQVVTFLHRAAGSPEPTSDAHNFTDLQEGDYYYNAVLWAVEKGIATGMSETTFAAGETCTRGQVVTFLYRYFSDEKASEPQNRNDSTLTLVESPATVVNGDMLRGNTYAVTSADGRAQTNVVYFPVTMYNYDQAVIRAATHKIEVEAGNDTLWNGMYFSGGSPSATSYTTDPDFVIDFDSNGNALIPNGNYLISASASGKFVVETVSNNLWSSSSMTATSNLANATRWTITQYAENGTVKYTIQTPSGKYMDISARNTSRLSNDPVYVSIYRDGQNVYIKKLDAENDGCYLNQLGSNDFFGGWTDGTPITFTAPASVTSREYAPHNFWNKKSGDNENGDLMYTGLVQDTLINDQIVFTVPDAGIFNNKNDVKDIYEYVGLPFVLSADGYYTFDSDINGVYFADTDGDGDSDPQSGKVNEPYNLHFDEKRTQGWANMNESFKDGSSNLWAPFNTNENDTGAGNIDYHFGMRADIPFSMTANGRVNAMKDDSAPITFTFSGDDDVWVFIDGHLVIDLGGIHNRLDVTIDFANNTITYFEENDSDNNNTTGSFNDTNFATTQQLFTVRNANGELVEGVIPQTRDAFAENPDHEMQIFYLERGEGTSNAQIKFNLPMSDTVLITKDATKSWSEKQDVVDGNTGDGTQDLTAREQAAVNNIDFGFTLYKFDGAYLDNTGNPIADSGLAPYPIANTKYILLDQAGNAIGNGVTDANGKFYLKNGQTAKFITDIPAEGVTYFVMEDQTPEGFLTPDYQYAGKAANGFSYYGEALNPDYDPENPNPNVDISVTNKGNVANAEQIAEHELPMVEAGQAQQNLSYFITAWGSTQASDSLEFICVNYMNADLPNPSAFANEDIIVIDYGLPVEIDPLANDVFRGDDVEIVAWGDETLKLNEVLDQYGYATDATTWTNEIQTFDSGNVTFNDVTYTEPRSADDNITRDTFTYTLNKQMTEVEVISYIIKVTSTTTNAAGTSTTVCRYSLAKIYIVPATTMYYEENFANMITFKNGKGTWDANATTNAAAVSAYQEPGVVGTVGDSTYGSDVAYLDDSGDSNGTSRHGDTTKGAIQFSYTFTGTGSSFFARTSATTGYLQVKLYEGTDIYNDEGKLSTNYKTISYVDTYYEDKNGTDEDSNGTLYNIPVYTTEDLPYGTYTLVVTVAKKGTIGVGGKDGSGKDFYLDGIRVIQPLNVHITKEEDGEPEYDAVTAKALSAYTADNESNVDIVTLRDKIITDSELDETNWNFVVFTDTRGEVKTAEDYKSIGPKEEVYLKPGQSVSFSIKYWHQDGYLLHLGMKAPFGTAGVQVGQNTYELKNAPDCYYNITGMQTSIVSETEKEQAVNNQGQLLYTAPDGKQVYKDNNDNYYYVDTNTLVDNVETLKPFHRSYYVATYTITATDGIVSLTNLKVTGNYTFKLVENVDIHVEGPLGEDSE